MVRRRQQRTKNAHYCILVNRQAAKYQKKPVDRLIAAIRGKGDRYTIVQPDSAMELYTQAGQMVKYRKESKSSPVPIQRWGKITALIACGGDGTFNLVARAALDKNIPVGVLPMGRFNNIARHLLGSIDLNVAIEKIVAGGYRTIDSGKVGDQLFFGSIGIGLMPSLANELKEHRTPRFGIGWSKLAARAAASVKAKKIILKIDAYRFEVKPLMLNINLLPYTVGLELSPASLADDRRAEIIFDRDGVPDDLSHYTRLIFKDKYLYGDKIGLYRGEIINVQPTKGRTLYLDGELLKLPDQSLEVSICEKRLKVFC